MAIKPLIYLACVLALTACALDSRSGSTELIREGSPAPDFTVRDKDGGEASLNDFRGSVVFLNFWRTDCVPCVLEMPEMESLTRVFKARKFRMMPISLDVDASDVSRFYREHSLTMPAYLDPEWNVASRFDVRAVPETFLIDRDGKVAKHYFGPQRWSSPEMVGLLEEMVP